MAGKGAPSGAVAGAADLRVAIVGALWHNTICDALVEGATRAVADAGSPPPTIVRVPGTFELPVAALALAQSHDAVVALGVVIRGETPHFDYVCEAATHGLTRVALDTGVPIGFGVLTCDTDEQAHDRSGLPGSKEDKGREAAEAAMHTAVLLREIRSQS